MPEGSQRSSAVIPTVVITLLAAYGIGVSIPKSSPATAPQPTKSSAASSSQTAAGGSAQPEYKHSAVAMLRDFLAVSPVEQSRNKPWQTGGKEQTGLVTDSGTGTDYRVKFLIATLPEPISPALRASFDNEIAAISAAASDAGYTLDSFDLPWQSVAKSESQGLQLAPEIDVAGNAVGAATSSSNPVPSYSVTSKTEPPRWEADPGIILFRSIEKDQLGRNDGRLLVVFIVGEAPTRGINKRAMGDALDQIAWLWTLPKGPGRDYLRAVVGSVSACCGKEPATEELNILGPGFSGSAASMRAELESWSAAIAQLHPELKINFHLFSGSATALFPGASGKAGSSIDLLRSATALFSGPAPTRFPGHRRYSGASTDFILRSATALLSAPLTARFSGFPADLFSNPDPSRDELLPKRCYGCTFQPVLVSDGLRWQLIVPALQQGISDATPFKVTTAPVKDPEIAILSEDTTYGDINFHRIFHREEQDSPILRLPFPLQISNLRTAFGNDKPAQGPGAPILGPSDVPEDDEGGQRRLDVIPSFSTRSAGYDQLVLSGLLTRIERDHTQYVGIMASDISDLTFLAGLVRQYSPDSMLFTLTSDLRMLRHEVNPDLYGMLVFSTYPLFNENQRWTWPWRNHIFRLFPNESAQGHYNAMLAALDCSNLMLEEGLPFIGHGQRDREDCASGPPSKPALWASVVGHDAIWPLGFEQPGIQQGPKFDWLRRGCPTYPQRFQLLVLVVALFCTLTALALLRPEHAQRLPFLPKQIASNTPAIISRLTDFNDRTPFVELQGPRRQYLASLGIGLLIAMIIASGYFLLPLRTSSGGLWVYTRVGLGIIVLLSLVLSACAAHVAVGKFLGSARRHPQEFPNAKSARSGVCSTAFVMVALVLAAVFMGHVFSTYSGFVPLLFFRVATWTNGVSPLKPLLFLAGAALILNWCHLRQMSLLEDSYISKQGFLGFNGPSFTGIRDHESAIARLLSAGPLDLPGAYFLLLAVIAVHSVFYFGEAHWFKYALDGAWFGRFYTLSSMVVETGLFFLLLRYLAVWGELHKLLRRLFFHSSRGCYESMRMKRLGVAEDPRLRLLEPVHSVTGVEYCLERARELQKLALDTSESALAKELVKADLPARIAACEKELQGLYAAAGNWKEAASADQALQLTMMDLSAAMTEPFDAVWRLGSRTNPPAAVSGESKDHKLVDQAELFIASRVVDFMRRVYPQMMNLVGFAVAGILAIMLASSSYPMPAPDTGLWIAWFALLTAVGVSMYVFVRLNMSRVISMLQGTTPGYFSFSSSFAIQLFFFGFLPILAMFGAHYPAALGGLFSWAGGVFSSAR
jgi:hypothetical protein